MEGDKNINAHSAGRYNDKGLVEDKFCPLRDLLMGWDLIQASPDARISIWEGVSKIEASLIGTLYNYTEK